MEKTVIFTHYSMVSKEASGVGGLLMVLYN